MLDETMLGISVQNKGIPKIPENVALDGFLPQRAALCNKKNVTDRIQST